MIVQGVSRMEIGYDIPVLAAHHSVYPGVAALACIIEHPDGTKSATAVAVSDHGEDAVMTSGQIAERLAESRYVFERMLESEDGAP